MKKVNLKAILLGLMTDIGGHLIITMFLGGGIFLYFGLLKQLPLSDVESFIRTPLSAFFWILTSLLITSLGGYVASRVAKEKMFLHSSVVGFSAVIFSFLSSEPPLSFLGIFINICPFLFAILGGLIAAKTIKNEKLL